ncbi:MAG: hypothetical protein ACHQRK_09980 [Gemmatimonadales bacterium]|jgi:hypothetical protein
MDNDFTNPYAGKHIPFKKGGWGSAIFIVLLALAIAATATWIHKTTYLHPQDLRMRAKGSPASHP